MPLLLATLAVLLLAPAAEAAAKERPPCRPKGATLVEGSGRVRVYEVRNRVVACAYASGRTFRLGRETAPDEVERVSALIVRGRYVAWKLSARAGSSQGPYPPDRLRLVDVPRGREVGIGGLGCELPLPSDGFYRAFVVGSLALTSEGRLAWICTEGSYSERVTEVHRFDGDGPALLDRETGGPSGGGDAIDPYTVAVSGGDRFNGTTRVYWSRASGPRSADLR